MLLQIKANVYLEFCTLSVVMMVISLVSQYSGGLLRFHGNHNSQLFFCFGCMCCVFAITEGKETFVACSVLFCSPCMAKPIMQKIYSPS